MFSGFLEKAVTTTISLGMMIFSSYQGSTPSFTNTEYSQRGNQIEIKANLANAFNDDFRQILQSGQEVCIDFEIELKGSNRTNLVNFSHRITFDTLNDTWLLSCEDINREYVIASWSQLIRSAAEIRYSGRHYLDTPIRVNIKASLPTINLGRNNKEFNLMLFWNYHHPSHQHILR